MNAHAGTPTPVEARRTIAHRRSETPHRSGGEFFAAAGRQTSRGLLPDTRNSLRVDVELAVEWLAQGSYFRSAALHVLEVAHLLAGNEGSREATAAQVKERSHGEETEALLSRTRLAASLTPAELRLLPLLAMHLSFREIGERLYVSRSTVKTQALSAYRKLLASSRSEAVERAAELGLMDATVATGACDLGRRPAVTQEQLTQLTMAVIALVDGGLARLSEAIRRVSASRTTKAVA